MDLKSWQKYHFKKKGIVIGLKEEDLGGIFGGHGELGVSQLAISSPLGRDADRP